MGIWNTIKNWFNSNKTEVKPVVEKVVEKAQEKAIEVVTEEITKIDVDAATKAIETRLAEIAEEKVTAKEIKAKVKKTEQKSDKTESKPKQKSSKPKAKPASGEVAKQPAKPRKKSEPKK